MCFFMQLKVIDKNKVKILIEDKDIVDSLLLTDGIDCQQKATREFILKLLNETYVRTGIDFLSSKVLIEVIPGVSGSYYIIITRISQKPEPYVEFDTTVKADEDMYLFELYHPENIFDISKIARDTPSLAIGHSKMFKYKEKYYLSVYFPPKTVSDEEFTSLIKSFCEFSSKCRWNLYNECILAEWGELLCDDPLKRTAAVL